MGSPADNSPLRGSQEQVILPATVALRLCVKGIRKRLGRSLITLTGIALGTAFLMAVVAGFHIKNRMSSEEDLTRQVERRLTVVRAEIGRLPGKRVLVLAGPACTALDRATIAALAKATAAATAGARADAVVVLGGYPIDAGGGTAVPAGAKLFVSGSQSQAGLKAKPLDIAQRPEEAAKAAGRAAQARYRTVWIVAASLLIMVIGIANAMLMSVSERVREIATMKCLGALSSFVVKLFLIESSLLGLAGALGGSILGAVFAVATYSYSFGLTRLLGAVSLGALAAYGLLCLAAGMALAIVAGIYPARVAARMVPAAALATNV